MATPSRSLTATFLALHIAGGIVGLPLVVLSIGLSRQTSRHPTLLNFCGTWFLSSIIFTLLLYAGKQYDDHPSFGLCLAQASMANGAFPMTSVAGVALVAHIWHGLGPARPWSQFGLASGNLKSARLTALLLSPYIVFLILVIPAAVIGHQSPGTIQNADKLFYCTIDSNVLNIVVQVIVIISMSIILLFEVLICKEILQNAYIRAGLNRSGFRLFLVRLAGFAIYAVIAFIVAALLLSNDRTFAPYILQASLPVIVLIFIGTQKEVLSVFGRLRCGHSDDEPYVNGHYRSKSTTTLMNDDRPPTPGFISSDLVQLNRFNSDKGKEVADDSSVEIFKSSVPFRMPKRPAVKGQGTMESFFNDPAPPRPTPAHTEPQRKNFESPPPPPKPFLPPQEPVQPPAPQPVQPYVVEFPEPKRVYAEPPPAAQRVNQNHLRDELDQNTQRVIESQKQTIARLLEEAGYTNKALDRLKSIEQTFHKAQNALTQERRTASQLRGYVNQLEFDLANQQTLLNEKIVQNKTLEDANKELEARANKLDKLTHSLDSALKDSVDKEMQWRKKYESLKAEYDVLLDDRDNLASDLHLFMDYFVSRDSPIEWDPPRGGTNGVRESPQSAFPEEIRQRIKQRASNPAPPRPFSKSSLRQTRRQTAATEGGKGSSTIPPPLPPSAFKQTKAGLTVESLDRLRPKMLELSGKMELSEKVSGLEELVREQAAIIEKLENVVDDERRERIRAHVEGSMGSWDIPNSISSSMIVRSSVMDNARRASSNLGVH